MDNLNQHGHGLIVNEEAKLYLKEACRWAKILSIIAFVMIGLGILISVALAVSMSTYGINYMGSIGLSLIYLLVAAVYIYPLWKLYNFSTRGNRAIEFDDSLELSACLYELKSCFRFIGILTIALIALYIFGFGLAMLTMMISG